MKQTSLEKFALAMAPATTGWTYAEGTDGYRYSTDVVASVIDIDEVANLYHSYVASANRYSYHGSHVGYAAEFDKEGRFLGGYDLYLRAARYYKTGEEGEVTWYIYRQTGRRGSPVYRTLKEILDKAKRGSPVGKAMAVAERAKRDAEREAEEAAKAARVKAIKPDVRNAVWNVKTEHEKALSEIRSNLKRLVSRATEALERLDEHTYISRYDFESLISAADDAKLNVARYEALSVVLNSELAPLFEGSPWSDE